MARERLSMRKIKEVLRLSAAGLNKRQIARSVNIARSTVAEYLKRAEAAAIVWPVPDDIDNAALESLLFPIDRTPKNIDLRPDFGYIHTELKKKGITLQLLWDEYVADNPGGYRYSQFCNLYRIFQGKLNLSMRQVHKAGEKMFVDFAGKTMGIVDPDTGEIREAQIFVAVLGASSYTYVEAVWSQDLQNWIACHTHAFEFFGGVAQLTIPDNLKSGVTKPCRYEPDLNPTYQDMAEHYGTAVITARIKKPKDKAKAEVGVQVVTRWILARLRKRTFFSLTELNAAISELLEWANNKKFAKLDGSRKSFFESLDKPALQPLPSERYEFAQFKKAVVNIDYHIEVDRHYYSVPYQLVKETVDIRATRSTVEVLFKGKRVASHARSYSPGRHTTILGHMPKSHREYARWSPSRIVSWAESIGPNCAGLTKAILNSREHPAQGFRSAMGIVRLTKAYSVERLETACRRALEARALSYTSVSLMLKNNLEGAPIETERQLVIDHSNIRGADYYH